MRLACEVNMRHNYLLFISDGMLTHHYVERFEKILLNQNLNQNCFYYIFHGILLTIQEFNS